MAWLSAQTVIYQIFIDRFALPSSDGRALDALPDDQPVFCGGTIRGIIEHFDHLRALGVNAIWISPFYQGVSFHGYHVTDLFAVDTRFGTESDLRELIDLAHAHGMKIVADFVPNHVSKEHPFFLEAQRDSLSPYREWFYFSHWPTGYLSFLDVTDLPKLNLDAAPARAHVINAARKWLSLGFDGFRLDHIPGPSNDFWKEFLGTLRTEFPEAEFFGEAWLYGVRFSQLRTLRVTRKYRSWLFGERYLMKQYGGLFPALLDFVSNRLFRSFVDGSLSPAAMDKKLEQQLKETRGTTMLTFLDNHDMDRILFVAHGDRERVKAAVLKQFQLPAPVVIYQGTEFGMTHERGMASFQSYGDLVARRMIPWTDPDHTMREFYARLIQEKVSTGTVVK